MSVFIKIAAAFGFAAYLTGAVHLDTPRWHTMAAGIHDAHPRAALGAQLRQLLASAQEKS